MPRMTKGEARRRLSLRLMALEARLRVEGDNLPEESKACLRSHIKATRAALEEAQDRRRKL